MDSAARGLRGARRFSILVFVGFCFLDVAFSLDNGVVSPSAPPSASADVNAPTPAPSATSPQVPAPTTLSPPPPSTAAPKDSVSPPKESPRPPISEPPPPSPPGVVLEPPPLPGLEPPPPPPPLTTEEPLTTGEGNSWNPSEKAGVVIASIAALLQVAVVAFLLIKRHQMLSTVDYDDIDDLESDDPRHNANYRHADSA